MSEFVASNGRRVVVYPAGIVEVIGISGTGTLSVDQVAALREFFRDERDKELGRWRWPENPEYVVYPKLELVLNEREAFRQPLLERWEADFVRDSEDEFDRAAVAYYEAHPAPKPWHDAKPGEVWELTYRSPRADEVSNRVMTVVQDGPNVSFFNEWRLHTIHYTGIESARRIWPEVSNG